MIERVDESARDLGELHSRVEGQHTMALDNRETAARVRDQQLACKFGYHGYKREIFSLLSYI